MTDIKIQIKELQNVSRKGLYLFVSAKNKPARYYKFDFGQAQIDATKKYYEDKFIKKNTVSTYKKYLTAFSERSLGITPTLRTTEHRKAEQYLAKIKKSGSILSQLKTGIKTVLVPNVLTTSEQELDSKKKELLQDLVLDKELITLLTQTQNFDKLRNRLDYRIIAETVNGEQLIEASCHGKTLTQVLSDIKGSIKGNSFVSKQKYRILDYLKKSGWLGERTGEGEIVRIKLYITFRRG